MNPFTRRADLHRPIVAASDMQNKLFVYMACGNAMVVTLVANESILCADRYAGDRRRCSDVCGDDSQLTARHRRGEEARAGRTRIRCEGVDMGTAVRETRKPIL